MDIVSKNHRFSQSNPRYKCRRPKFFAALSERLGYEVKCRDARCSIDCNRNWAIKHGVCLDHHLSTLPDGLTVYRGHLRMPENASPKDHDDAKGAFLRAVKRWGKRHGYTVELHGVLHITDPTNAHWDVVAYSNAPRKPLCEFVSAAWDRAGGLRQSLVPMEGAEIAAVARYTAKAINSRTNSRTRRDARFLPAPQVVLGLDRKWSTRGFWIGTNVDAIWSELIKDWLKSRESSNKTKMDITDTHDNCTAIDLAPLVDDRYIPGEDPHRDRLAFPWRLPTDPAESIGLTDYAARWGVSQDYMRGILAEDSSVVVQAGELVDGRHVFSGYYRIATP